MPKSTRPYLRGITNVKTFLELIYKIIWLRIKYRYNLYTAYQAPWGFWMQMVANTTIWMYSLEKLNCKKSITLIIFMGRRFTAKKRMTRPELQQSNQSKECSVNCPTRLHLLSLFLLPKVHPLKILSSLRHPLTNLHPH